MYGHCNYYAPIYRANGIENALFARIAGAEYLQDDRGIGRR